MLNVKPLAVFRHSSVGVVVAMLIALPATAQVRSIPVGGGNLPPCETTSNAFPCGVILSAAGSGVSSRAVGAMAGNAGAQVRYEFASIAAVAATVPNSAAMRALSLSSLRVIPDRRVSLIEPLAKGRGGGPITGQQTPAGVARIGAPLSGNTGSGIGVAILDTGLDFNHQDLNLNTTRFSYVDAFGGTCQDQNGHGTHVGGIVAALNNSIDVIGVAPDATLYCARVLDANGSGSDSTVMAGLDWIWQQNGGLNPAKPPKISVANMSLGRAGAVGDNSLLHDIIKKLRAQGVATAVSAGNDPAKQISNQIPAAYPEVMAIASTTALDGTNSCKRFNGRILKDTASVFTTDGAGVAISAPGDDQENISGGCLVSHVGILSLKLGGGTTRMAGTSMAAPHVAGVAALLYKANSLMTPDCVSSRITAGAFQVGVAPLDSPASSYSFDGVREGVVSAVVAANATCP